MCVLTYRFILAFGLIYLINYVIQTQYEASLLSYSDTRDFVERFCRRIGGCLPSVPLKFSVRVPATGCAM